jgi:YVTN family beta-propeller protein
MHRLLPLVAVLSLLLAACGPPEESGRLYVANLRSSDVTVIEPASGRELARLPLAENPHEFALLGDAVLVSNYRSAAITRIDGELSARQSLLAGEPHGIAVLDELVAVTQGRRGSVALLDHDGQLLREVETGGEPHMVVAAAGRFYAVDAAGGRLLEIDPATGTVARQTAVGRLPESVAVQPGDAQLAVANARSRDLSLVERATLRETRRVPLDGAPVRVAYSPDGRTLAASLNDRGRVALLDAGGRQRAAVSVGDRPDGLAFSTDGRRLYVALVGERRVAVVRVADATVVRYLDAGDGPSGLLLVRCPPSPIGWMAPPRPSTTLVSRGRARPGRETSDDGAAASPR